MFAYSPLGEHMANSALAVLETALRERKLDRTLTTSLPPLERSDPAAFIPFEIAAVDAVLRGGLPRGQVSELAGPHSSGRTTMLLQLLAAATRGGEIAALIDTCDGLDVASAAAAGIDLNRLLWIRGASSGRVLSALSESKDRIVEGSDMACLLIVPEPLARSAGGLTVMCTGRTTWNDGRVCRFTGLDTGIRVISPRRRVDGSAAVRALANDSD